MLRTLALTGSWQALPDIQAARVNILNNSGAALAIRYAWDSASSITLKDGQFVTLPVKGLRAATVEINGAGSAAACVFTL